MPIRNGFIALLLLGGTTTDQVLLDPADDLTVVKTGAIVVFGGSWTWLDGGLHLMEGVLIVWIRGCAFTDLGATFHLVEVSPLFVADAGPCHPSRRRSATV